MSLSLQQCKIVFMGTSEFAVPLLQQLHINNISLVGVITQPDKKTGRKQLSTPSPVKVFSQKHSLSLKQFPKLTEDAVEEIKALAPDLIIVASYGLILPKKFLEIPKLGCVNIHASLLPAYRGASPIQTALKNGETKTGITIMLMDEGVDTGLLLKQKSVPVDKDETFSELQSKLAKSAAEILLPTLVKYIQGAIKPRPQNNSLTTNTRLISKKDGMINWNSPAEEIYNTYRAFKKWPGSYTFFDDRGKIKKLVLNKISLSKSKNKSTLLPGQVEQKNGIIQIGTKTRPIVLEQITLEGSKQMNARSLINGKPHFIGSFLNSEK